MNNDRFISKGRERNLEKMRNEITAITNAKYEVELRTAGLLQRLIIKWKIRQEIKVHLESSLPQDALY